MLALSGTLATVTFKTAQAGFEWTPASPKVEPPSVITPPPAAPVPAIESMKIEPVETVPANTLKLPPRMQTLEIEALESDGPNQVMQVKTLPPPSTTMSTETKIRQTRSAPALEIQQTAPTIAINPFPNAAAHSQKNVKSVAAPPRQTPPQKQQKPERTYSEVSGFGADLPLALALRQVVPAEYSFSFGEGVNPGYRVSWNGGRSWDAVLKDMISPLDLSAQIFEKSILLTKNHSEGLPAKAAQAQEPQAGDAPKRTNITDPGETPEGHSFGGFKIDGPLKSKESSTEKITENKESSSSTTWEAKQGDSLKATLDEWSKQADAEFAWNATHDYTLNSNIVINGTFSSALEVLFASAVNPVAGPDHELKNISGTEDKEKLIVQDKPSSQHSS